MNIPFSWFNVTNYKNKWDLFNTIKINFNCSGSVAYSKRLQKIKPFKRKYFFISTV